MPLEKDDILTISVFAFSGIKYIEVQKQLKIQKNTKFLKMVSESDKTKLNR